MNHVKAVITPKEAGRLLGRSQKTIEHGLRTGGLPFGTAYCLPSGRYVYIIPKDAFEQFMKEVRSGHE